MVASYDITRHKFSKLGFALAIMPNSTRVPQITQKWCGDIQCGVRIQVGEQRFSTGNFIEAAQMFGDFATAPELADFLTLAAYDVIVLKDLVQPKM